MSVRHYVMFPEATGDPGSDNEARAINQDLSRRADEHARAHVGTVRGWKARKRGRAAAAVGFLLGFRDRLNRYAAEVLAHHTPPEES